ncbi:hypothetical protein [Pelagimonas varians]|uniref:Uncharacterized protein n=1 Tax=Pelagimonas varians TaxID=696760 RepID=A0A238JZR6_9RHOB|nr:hypothetical protein [Pelagimonas varians]PYG33109.1 hypothetical protein C8N36_102104 [Pelagimonas varians]SMX35707.1 hypothetical protein PEV8663_00566 [Pelagimonas varians]
MTAQLKSVNAELELYPISASERLDSHFFLQWNLKRWRGSSFRKKAYLDPEVGFYGFELFCKAQDETPIGTLPFDDADLAFMLHLPLDRWKSLRKRDLSPLQGWSEVLCDNGEIRWAHPVVTEIAVEALKSKRRNAAKLADDRMRKRLTTIAARLRGIPGAARYAESDDLLNQISDWIDKAFPGGSATEKRVKEALNDLSSKP